MKLRFPFVVMRRTRYVEILESTASEAYHDGYEAALELKAEVSKSRKAITKPKKSRP